MLDIRFGKAQKPLTDVATHEQKYRPVSLQILDKVSAPILKRYMEDCANLLLIGVVHTHIPILWLVRESGEIAFALEETIWIDTGQPAGLWPKALYDREGKLGHPALCGDGSLNARLGGDFLFRKGEWWIANKSGRYGRFSETRKEHLENVCDEMKKFGLTVKTKYLGN